MTRPLRLGMVGGGEGAFIGAVHRIAARLDGQFTLVAGALSSDADRARASGAALGLAPDRTYDDFALMARRESRRRDGIEAVAIVTPNHLHAAPAIAFLKHAIPVICDKPLTATLTEARRLARMVARAGTPFILTHTYAGYPMVRQARAMVAAGDIGAVRLVQVEYAQDWLTEDAAAKGSRQADWRTDPARAGAGAIGDIGTHAFHLAGYVSGLRAEALAADLGHFVPGRRVDDNAHVMMRFGAGARGMLWASQIAVGHENTLRLRIFGATGGIEWSQEDPTRLWFTPFGEPRRLMSQNGAGTVPAAARLCRLPAGHPEGYLEAFANLYADAARAIRAHQAGEPAPADVDLPGIDEGMAGMAFIDACQRSGARNSAWVAL